MVTAAWRSLRLNGIRAWIYLNLAMLLYLNSLSAFRRLISHVDDLPEAEKLAVLQTGVAGFLSAVMLLGVAVRRKEQGSPWPIALLKLRLMVEPKGRREWEYQIERLLLAWKKADAEKEIRARREERSSRK